MPKIPLESDVAASTIGIKIANGQFYPLVKEDSNVKKRLVLTTVHDKQDSVQIDLYKSQTAAMGDAIYIGSLVVEKIKPRPKGEPSIEMVITSTPEGNINAQAIDLDSGSSGEHHYLSVSLKSLEDLDVNFDFNDLDLETHEAHPPVGLYEKARKVKDKKRVPLAAIIIAIAVALLIAAAGIWYFFFWGKEQANFAKVQQSISEYFHQREQIAEKPPAPVYTPPPPPPVVTPAAPAVEQPMVEQPEAAPEPVIVQTPPEPPVIEAPVEAPISPVVDRTRNAPVYSYNIPAVIPGDGVPYLIRWGDTLWDISEAFYRTPLLYPRIARFNNIRNPDRIISGTTIRIPPRE